MQKWEHAEAGWHVGVVDNRLACFWQIHGQPNEPLADMDSLIARLGELGDLGWELVTVSDADQGRTFYYKRPKP